MFNSSLVSVITIAGSFTDIVEMQNHWQGLRKRMHNVEDSASNHGIIKQYPRQLEWVCYFDMLIMNGR